MVNSNLPIQTVTSFEKYFIEKDLKIDFSYFH